MSSGADIGGSGASRNPRLHGLSVAQKARADTYLSSASFCQPRYVDPVSAWIEHAPFASWLVSVLRPRSFVELGTHGGYSYFAVCQAVEAHGLDTRCYAVDHWKGDKHAGLYGEEVFARAKDHNDKHYAAFSRLVRSTFDEAASHFPDKSIDLLHIDGQHFYEDVAHDFETWRPKLSERSVVLFHDTNVREHGFGVFRLWGELCAGCSNDFEFHHAHGLGVLGYGGQLPAGVAAFFDATKDAEAAQEVRRAYARLGAAIRGDLTAQQAALKLADTKTRLESELARSRDEAAAQAARAAAADAARTEAQTRIAALETAAAEAERRAAEVSCALDERTAALTEARRRITTLETAAADAERRVAEAAKTLDEAQRRVIGLEAAALVSGQRAAQLARTIDERNADLTRARETIAGIETALAQRENELARQRQRFADLKGSLSWRLMAPFREMYRPFRDLQPYRVGVKLRAAWRHPVNSRKRKGFRANRMYEYASALPPDGGRPSKFAAKLRALARHPLSRERRRARREQLRVPALRTPLPSGDSPVIFPAGVSLPELCAIVPHRLALELEQDNAIDPPLVSIIIPVHNQLDFTLRCLMSIARHPSHVRAEIIVSDDASNDDTPRVLGAVLGLRYIRHENKLGFLRNCNRASKEARGEFLVFLNNDTEVQKGWLDHMLALFDRNDRVGLVGAKLVFPNGRLQEAGSIIWRDASGHNFGRNDDPAKPEYNYVREVDYCSGACIAIKTSLFREFDGFDVRYAPAYYEDTDLAFRVRQTGRRVLYQPHAVVVHHEGVSNGTDTRSGIKAYQVANQTKFFEQWRKELDEFHFDNGGSLFLARDRSRDRQCVLIVDHYIPQPDRDAGSRSVFHIVEVLVEAGFNVKFWPHNLNRDPEYVALLQDLGVEVFYGSHYAGNFVNWIRENGRHVNIALLSRPHVAMDCIRPLRKHSRAKIIFFGHDIHHLRLRRLADLQGVVPGKESGAKEMEELERQVWSKVDVIYYPSSEETAYVQAAGPRRVARTIPLLGFREFAPPEDDALSERRDILFVGGFGHPPNEDAAIWFVNQVLPIIRGQQAAVRVCLVGSNPTPKVQRLGDHSVVVTGHVSDNELATHYRNARVVVAPLRYGAGMKGKMLEAMRYGVPVATTPSGVQGMADVADKLLVRSEPHSFAEAVLALLTDDTLWRKQRRIQSDYVRKNFSQKALRDFLLADFGQPMWKAPQ